MALPTPTLPTPALATSAVSSRVVLGVAVRVALPSPALGTRVFCGPPEDVCVVLRFIGWLLGTLSDATGVVVAGLDDGVVVVGVVVVGVVVVGAVVR